MKDNHIATQKRMAEILEMDEGAFSRLLRLQPSNLISIDLMAKLHETYGVTPNERLLEEEGV